MHVIGGNWEFSDLLRDCLVAQKWNIDPVDFWGRSKLSRAVMIATTEVSAEMDLFESKRK